MADNVAITPGAGVQIASDDVGGVQFQKIKLDVGGDGASVPATGDGTNGLDVDVTRVQGVVQVGDNSASLTVDSSQLPAALVGGRLDVTIGASPATVPVSDAAGSLTTDTSQLPGALVGGRLDVHIGGVGFGGGGLPISDNGASLSVDDGGSNLSVDDGGGSLTVDGAVTAAQGAAAAVAASWPVKLTDATNTAGLTNVSGDYALKVDVVQAVGASAQTDKAAFTEGSGKLEVIGGVYNETPASDPAEDQAAAARITAKRGLHVNLRAAAGTEIGTAGAPVRTDPTGTTTQPVSGTVAATLDAATVAGAAKKTADYDTGAGTDTVSMMGLALPASGGAVAGGTASNPVRTDPTGTTAQPITDNGGSLTVDQPGNWSSNVAQVGGNAVVTVASGVQKIGIVDEANAAFSETNPLPVRLAYPEHTRFKFAKTYAASESDIALFTPTGGKRYVLEGFTISPTASGVVKIFDNTNAAANMHFQGTPNGTAPNPTVAVSYANPVPSEAVNNVLRYSTGGGAGGDITVWGYEV